MQAGSSTGLSSQTGSGTDLSDGVLIGSLEKILNARISTETSEKSSTVVLNHVQELVQEYAGLGKPISIENVVAASYLEVISNQVNGGAQDKATSLTNWILESIDRAHHEETNNPRVNYPRCAFLSFTFLGNLTFWSSLQRSSNPRMRTLFYEIRHQGILNIGLVLQGTAFFINESIFSF